MKKLSFVLSVLLCCLTLSLASQEPSKKIMRSVSIKDEPCDFPALSEFDIDGDGMLLYFHGWTGEWEGLKNYMIEAYNADDIQFSNFDFDGNAYITENEYLLFWKFYAPCTGPYIPEH